MRITLLHVFLIAGCGGAASGTPTDAGGDDSGSSPPPLRLISADYSLAAGEEVYTCRRLTLTSDLLVKSITPVNGPGTHHQTLGLDPRKAKPDGMARCEDNIQFDVASWQMLFASGVGSPALHFPEGVAAVLHAGDQLVLQMHLLNASSARVSGTAALDVDTLAAGTSVTPVQMLLAGPIPNSQVTPDIPPGPGYKVDGRCTLPSATRYFTVFPHMHQLGKHIKVTATTAAADTALIYDSDFVFTEQVFREFPPLSMAAGDTIDVHCTYDNGTGQPVSFGQSSFEEMCFAISYVAPPVPTKMFGDFCFE